jgi:Berberine and berberine like
VSAAAPPEVGQIALVRGRHWVVADVQKSGRAADSIGAKSGHAQSLVDLSSVELPIFTLGGAFARIGEDDCAFGGSRNTRFVVNISAGAPTAAELEPDRAWVREFWSALVPHASGVGSYVNFMSEYDENRVRAAYGPAKYDKLAQLKAKWDPRNVFHLNANIKPA